MIGDNIFIIEDDTCDAVKDAATIAALGLKGSIWWGNGLYHLTQMMEVVTPRFLILDNNLPGGGGLSWINASIESGKISADTIIASISSSDNSLIYRNAEHLDQIGIGAFTKGQIAELVLWMARRDFELRSGVSHISQLDYFDPREHDDFITQFRRSADGLFSPYTVTEHLNEHTPRNLRGLWPTEGQIGKIIFSEQETFGFFEFMVKKTTPATILKMDKNYLMQEFTSFTERNNHSPEMR